MNQTLTFTTTTATPIHCSGCEQRIVRALRLIAGVTEVAASADSQQVRVVLDPAQTTAEQIQAKLEFAGFAVQRNGGPA